MVSAIIEDLLALPGCSVATTCDKRLSHLPVHGGGKYSRLTVASTDDEQAAFDRLVTECDATLIIAPETNGVLVDRVDRVLQLGRTAWNCRSDAIRLCSDKLRLARHLESVQIPTISTASADLSCEPWDRVQSGVVLKPRDGAGSWLTFGIPDRDSAAWQRAVNEVLQHGMSNRMILQPWIIGQSLSVGCICDEARRIEVLPIARQSLSYGRFQYLGGELPADISSESKHAIDSLVARTCESIAGLRGYIGIDLLIPDGDPASPRVVEINPRLTTSYVGYRRACDSNLASRIINFKGGPAPLNWKPGKVVFRSDGSCT